jgi:hypothetical protein
MNTHTRVTFSLPSSHPQLYIHLFIHLFLGFFCFFVPFFHPPSLIHSQDIPDPTAIDDVFDDISYAKGSLIVRMLQQYVGPQVPQLFSTFLKFSSSFVDHFE